MEESKTIQLKTNESNIENFEFQIYDFCQSDVNTTPADLSDDDDVPEKFEYRIHVFGRTLNDKSVYVKIEDYKPYFCKSAR